FSYARRANGSRDCGRPPWSGRQGTREERYPVKPIVVARRDPEWYSATHGEVLYDVIRPADFKALADGLHSFDAAEAFIQGYTTRMVEAVADAIENGEEDSSATTRTG